MSQAIKIQREPGRASYSDSSKASALLALDLNNGNIGKTAKDLGIPYDTMYYWAKKHRAINSETVILHGQLKEEIPDKLEEVARAYIERALKPAAIKKTSGYYAILGASDALKTRQLMMGMPTSITGSVMSDDERNLRLAELLAKAQERKATVSETAQDPE